MEKILTIIKLITEWFKDFFGMKILKILVSSHWEMIKILEFMI